MIASIYLHTFTKASKSPLPRPVRVGERAEFRVIRGDWGNYVRQNVEQKQEERTTDHTDDTDEEGRKGEPHGWQSRTTDDGSWGHVYSRMNGKSSCQRCVEYFPAPAPNIIAVLKSATVQQEATWRNLPPLPCPLTTKGSRENNLPNSTAFMSS